MNTYKSEFGESFTLSQCIQDALAMGGLKDTSWRNDMCPSFAVDDKRFKITLWVDFERPEDREFPTWARYRVFTNECTAIYEGDEAQAALDTITSAMEGK